jgi:patatin-like phospholipase/acyl hydrolase
MSQKLKILALDGGGTRGIIPATILHLLLKDRGKTLFEEFDVVAGTSTGGILATALASGQTTEAVVNMYLNESDEIFFDTKRDDFWDSFPTFGKVQNLRGADYNQTKFKKILRKYFDEMHLREIRSQINGGISEAEEATKWLMVCAFELGPKGPDGKHANYKPKVFHSDFKRDQKESLVDLCLKTSAGPVYFPIYEGFIDGGVAMNNPAMSAIAFAMNANHQKDSLKDYRLPKGEKKGLGKKIDEIKVLSIGTGTSNLNFIEEKEIGNGDWGLWKWKDHIANMLTETNMTSSEYYVRNILQDNQYKRLQIDFSKIDVNNILYKDYIKKGKAIDLDVKERKHLEAMKKLAEALYVKEKDRLIDFLGA